MVGDGLPLGWLAPIDWDGEAEDAALVDLRINFHEAVVELNQLHRDKEAKSGSSKLICERINLLEALEQRRHLL